MVDFVSARDGEDRDSHWQWLFGADFPRRSFGLSRLFCWSLPYHWYDAMDIEVSESVLPQTHLEEHPPYQTAVINEDIPGIIELTDDDLSITLVEPMHRTHQPHTRNAWVHLERAKAKPATPSPSRSPVSQVRDREVLATANAEIPEDNAKASGALFHLISKTDFNKMQAVGQFNLGFIVARWRKCKENEEKRLDQTTVIESRRLFSRQVTDDLLAVENMDVLKRNGFEVVCEGGEGEEEDRLHLVMQSRSKDTFFYMKDLEELIHLMHDRSIGTMVRCSKARAMTWTRTDTLPVFLTGRHITNYLELLNHGHLDLREDGDISLLPSFLMSSSLLGITVGRLPVPQKLETLPDSGGELHVQQQLLVQRIATAYSALHGIEMGINP
ncbi:hypothetical protein AZE42_03050 [Rhizopogon vesiculosus]|uniref:Uncharacterized protein n=1 Tax=Rhizopogon vesiculosus TaxID=180088 RepID=A0A1J8QBE7_9AGAM|nr:hypothetical protein AZE42_03050 [Rhizopogon vesiculosus]